jgi:hypothetical protein
MRSQPENSKDNIHVIKGAVNTLVINPDYITSDRIRSVCKIKEPSQINSSLYLNR